MEPKPSRITEKFDEGKSSPTAEQIRDQMMNLASKLTKDNLLKAYREKLLEAMEKG